MSEPKIRKTLFGNEKKTYSNGDFEITDKKTGQVTSFSKIRPDGKRERDGK